MILLLHNRYRTLGGEERVVGELERLIPEELGEPAIALERESASASKLAAGMALLRGGSDPGSVKQAVRQTGARVVHAHNLLPRFGWRALAAARGAGARTVLTMHQYRLVCAVGTCLNPRDEDCLRCHGRDTRPGVRLNCRGGSRAEAALYAASLSRWSARMVAEADALMVPSRYMVERLAALGAPLEGRDVAVVPNPIFPAAKAASPATGQFAICSARLTRDKGVDLAIEACALAGRPLVVTGHGPRESEYRDLAARLGADVRFAGRVAEKELVELRAGAAIAVVPSRFAETFGLSAAEAMAAGLPVVSFDVGALGELIDDDDLAPPADPVALAELIDARWGDAARGAAYRERIAVKASPRVVASQLAVIYDG